MNIKEVYIGIYVDMYIYIYVCIDIYGHSAKMFTCKPPQKETPMVTSLCFLTLQMLGALPAFWLMVFQYPPFFPRASDRRVLLIVEICCTFSDLHILSSHFSYLHILSSHLPISSQLVITFLVSSHLVTTPSHIFTSCHHIF